MKLRDISIGVRLFMGLGIIILLVIVLGVQAYIQSNRLWQNTNDLYNHPFQVSEATRDIKADIIEMQWLMKDIVLDENLTPANIIDVSHQIDNYEKKVDKSFDVINDRYLGDKTDIDSAYNSFRDWKPFRDMLIGLRQHGNDKEKYTLFRTVNTPYMNKMLNHIQVMINYSSSRADSFFLIAQKDRSIIITRLLVLMGMILMLSILVGYLLIRGIRNPLLSLTLVAEQFRQKNYKIRSDYKSASEIGRLASTFNSLAAKVEQELSVKENAAWITGLILKENELESFNKVLLNLLMTKTGSQVGAIYFLNEDETLFEHHASIGLAKENCKTFFNHTKEGEFGMALSEMKIVRITQIPGDTVFTMPAVTGMFRPREIITIPIIDGRKVVSIISLASLTDYASDAVQLINELWLPLTARIHGLLAFRTIKDYSEKLNQQNKELEEKSSELIMQTNELKEYNIELELQKRQLDEANQLKSSFLSNMSHELRTPLNSVIALSGVLNRRLNGKIPEDEFKYLGIIEKNGKQLLLLINDILDLSRIEAGKEDVNYSVFSAYDLIQDLVASLEPISYEKRISLVNHISPDLASIVSDSSKVHHIFQNIIGNAIKFTTKGSVEISAFIENERIYVSVKDTGIGISKDNIRYIFDEFRQADGRASRVYGGTGLGLAIAKKYSNILQGSVEVESQLEKGSTFTVILPTIPAYYQFDENKQKTQPYKNKNENKITLNQGSVKGKNILLVEDNESTIIQMKEILLEEEYRIKIAKNGKEALEIIDIFIPDAIILDLMMPKVDGFEVLASIRKVKQTSEIPVLILSAKHVTKEELSFLQSNHIFQLIQKGDIKRNELLNHIRNMVLPQKEKTAEQITINPNLVISTLKASILIIEDNPDNMETVKALLSGDHEIIEAFDGLQGLEKAKMLLPDLILLDVSLPGMDGLEVLNEIKKDKRIQHIPVIALTARAMNGDREDLLAYGFDDYISKPIDSTLLELTINEWLNGK
jgi:signal transduction histidine kinase/CheY-like chemotaxis protein/HAMP domain-containing protein